MTSFVHNRVRNSQIRMRMNIIISALSIALSYSRNVSETWSISIIRCRGRKVLSPLVGAVKRATVIH
jgi:hypothetical protein